MALKIGQKLGSYEITSLLGKGGMGEVYRARDTRLKRDVAIKVLPDAFCRDRERVSRFEREAEALASLNHPHIASIHHLDQSGGSLFLVLEFVDGESLNDYITRGPIAIDQALEFAKGIAEAIEAAHERGIVHRDIKPANIKITGTGVVKVLDFGLAKAFATGGSQPDPSEASTVRETRAGMIMGTAAYMSPEQARGRQIDKRTDIWAFGCVLYEMLAGRAAFGGTGLTDTLAAVLEHEPDWTALPANTPSHIERMLRRCLQKDAKRRLHDIADARVELEDPRLDDMKTQAANTSHAPVSSRAVAVFALMLLVLFAVAVWRVRPSDGQLPMLRLDVVTPPISDANSLYSFALSPNGRYIVFAAIGKQRSQLWLRALDQTTAQPLAGTEGGNYPFWAPDSASIGFFADGLLKRIDISGGKPQTLANARNPLGGSWSRDGLIVFAPFSASPLMVVPASGGTPTAATRLRSEEGGHRLPTFLPDGRRFLFHVSKDAGVYLGSLDGRDTHQRIVVSEAAAAYLPGYILIVRQGVLMAVAFDEANGSISGEPFAIASQVSSHPGIGAALSVSGTGLIAYRSGEPVYRTSRQIASVDRRGTINRTASWPGNYVQVGPNGEIATIRGQLGNNDIWIVEGGSPRRFSLGPLLDILPVWSPDGKRIVFSSNRTGPFNLFENSVRGIQEEQILRTSSENELPVDWSPDGRILLYVKEEAASNDDLWALPLDGNRNPVPVLQQSFAEDQAQFSPDGRWIAYRSNQSGMREIYIGPFPGPGGPRQVSTRGGIQPRWSRDGRELFYIEPDNRLMSVPISDTQTMEFGPATLLFTARFGNLNNAQMAYDVTSDGQRFIVDIDENESEVRPITIVQNWMTLLKR